MRCGGERGVFGFVCPAGRFLVVCAKQIIDISGLREEGSFKTVNDCGSVRITSSCGVELSVLRR